MMGKYFATCNANKMLQRIGKGWIVLSQRYGSLR